METAIYLCGFMGCGKTTIGKALARSLCKPFYDLDSYIVADQGKTIPAIFKEQGEAGFRAIETECLKTLCKQSGGAVVAAGGGTFVSQSNARIVKAAGGAVVFLDVPFARCYQRIRGDANRPIVMQKTKDELHRLYADRIAAYRASADLVFPCQGSPNACARALAALLRELPGRV